MYSGRGRRNEITNAVVLYDEDDALALHNIGNGPKDVPRRKAVMGGRITMVYQRVPYHGQIVCLGDRRTATEFYNGRTSEDGKKKRYKKFKAPDVVGVDVPRLAASIGIRGTDESQTQLPIRFNSGGHGDTLTCLNGDHDLGHQNTSVAKTMEQEERERQISNEPTVGHNSPGNIVQNGVNPAEKRSGRKRKDPREPSSGDSNNNSQKSNYVGNQTDHERNNTRRRAKAAKEMKNDLVPSVSSANGSRNEISQYRRDPYTRSSNGYNDTSAKATNQNDKVVKIRKRKRGTGRGSYSATTDESDDVYFDAANTFNELGDGPDELADDPDHHRENPDEHRDDSEESDIMRNVDSFDARLSFNQSVRGEDIEKAERRKKARRRRPSSPQPRHQPYRPGKVVITHDNVGNRSGRVQTLYGQCLLSKTEIKAYLNFVQQTSSGVDLSSAVRTFYRGFFPNYEKRTMSTTAKSDRLPLTNVEQELLFTMIHEHWGYKFPYILDDGVVRSTEEEVGNNRRGVINSIVQLPSDDKTTRKRQVSSHSLTDTSKLTCACDVSHSDENDGAICITCWLWLCDAHARVHRATYPNHTMRKVPRYEPYD